VGDGPGVRAVLAGSAGGQAMLLLSTPVLTRLYSVAEFGVLTVFTALVGLLVPVAAGRMDAAVPLPRRDSDATCLAVIGLAATAGAATLAGLVLLLAGPWIGGLLGVPAIAGQWAPLALALAAGGAYQVASAWLVRRRRYRALGVRDLAGGVGQAVCQVGLGLAGASAAGLTLGFGCGRLAGLVGLAGPTARRSEPRRAPRPRVAWRDLRRGPRVAWRDLRRTLVRYRRFPLVASWSAL
jgi:O-antigen/teichoic acid export membrane protein